MRTPPPLRGVGSRARALEPDAHGQAALLLAESTLHALVDNAALTNDQAIVVVETASEVKVDVAAATGESDSRMQASLALLAGIRRSFSVNVKM